MSKPRTILCPKCKGVGLIETRFRGKLCRECGGKGRVPLPPPEPKLDK